jgi:RNA polymerase sigma factor (sigma-70 family)
MLENTGNQFTNSQIQTAAVLANDDKALDALYTANFYKTEAFVLANSGTADEAKDIYQEAFIAVWQNIKAGRFVPQNGSSLEAYLFQIVKYKWYDNLKAAKRMKLLPVEDNSFIEAAYNEEEQNYIEKVEQHFKNLGEPCREVLTLFYFMKQSMQHIAAGFSWTEATAKNNKYRCLQRLRNMVAGNNK